MAPASQSEKPAASHSETETPVSVSRLAVAAEIASRYRSLGLYVSGGALAFLFAARYQLPLPFDALAPQPVLAYAQAIAVWVITLALCSALLRPRWRHLRPHLALRYPPLVVAVVCSYGIAAFVDRRLMAPHTRGFFAAEDYVLAGLVMLAFSVANGAAGLIRNYLERIAATGTSPRLRELPLLDPKDDRFDVHAIALRLADRLRAGELDIGIGLTGPFGSGKTTIVNFVRRELDGGDRVWLSRVSCWGFDTSRDALRYTLATAIDRIEQEVDCRSLRSLPRAYQRAFERPGALSLVGDLATDEQNPERVLARLSPLLIAVGARLVVVVEDVDRAEDPDFSTAQIERLLYSLKDVRGVSFIVSCGTPSQTDARPLDLAKVCDRIELVPPVEHTAVAQVLRELRDSARRLAEHDVQPAGAKDAARKVDQELDPEVAALLGWAGKPGLLAALAELLATPRALRHVERDVRELWASLHGEVDFWDTVLLGALRYGAPTAFNFIVHHRDEVRTTRREPLAARGAEEEDSLRALWSKTVGQGADRWAIDEVVEQLGLARLSGSPNTGQRPQGLRLREPADYLRRLLAARVLPGDVRDQDVLSDIDGWKSRTRTEPLLEKLAAASEADDTYARRWHHFARDDEGLRLLELASTLFTRLRPASGPKVLRRTGLQSVWATAHHCRAEYPLADRVKWVETHAIASLTTSVQLANEFYYWWASEHGGLLDGGGRAAIRRALCSAARGSFAKSVAATAEAFDVEFPGALRELVFPTDQDEAPSEQRAPADWAWLAPTMLLGAVERAAVFLPQITYLCSDSTTQLAVSARGRASVRHRYVLVPQVVTSLFGSDLPTLVDAVAAGIGCVQEDLRGDVSAFGEALSMLGR